MTLASSRVNEDSILAVQVFDQRKFKKKDQGFLGVVNIRVGDSVELLAESDGELNLSFFRAQHPKTTRVDYSSSFQVYSQF